MKKLVVVFSFALIAVAAFGQKSLVLAPLQNDGNIPDGQIRTLTRLLENALQRTKQFDIIDRSAVEDILKEHGFQLSDLSNSRKTAELGKLLNADYLVRPSVMPLAGDVFLEARIVDVNTARMLNSAEVRIKADLSDSYEKLGEFSAALTGAVGGGGGSGGARPVTGGQSGKEYKIGDFGPAGGIVFYDKGVFSNGWRYLEAAPLETEFKAQWGAFGQSVAGTGTAVGTGKRNTQLITDRLQQLGENGKAAQLCVNLDFDGYKDWFLPSKDELDLMYKNLKQKGLGGFTNIWYWSSSEDNNTNYAWVYHFGESKWDNPGSNKNYPGSVRAIRQF